MTMSLRSTTRHGDLGLACHLSRAESSCVDDYWDVVPRRYQRRHAKRKSNLIEFLAATLGRRSPARSAPTSSTPPAFATVLRRRARLPDKSSRAARPIARLHPASPGARVPQLPSHERSFYAIKPSNLRLLRRHT